MNKNALTDWIAPFTNIKICFCETTWSYAFGKKFITLYLCIRL